MNLIINADDFGLSESTNDAIIELANIGSISSTTVMTNMPLSEAINNVSDKIGIGLHVNLTQGYPVSNPSNICTLVDNDGKFFPKKLFVNKIRSREIKQKHIYTELKAQYLKLYDLVGDRIGHFDSHQGSNKYSIVINALTKISNEAQKKFGLRSYRKVYLKKLNRSHSLLIPSVKHIRRLGAKRIILEYAILLKMNWRKRNFNLPDGFLLNQSHDTIQLLNTIKEIKTNDFPDIVTELSCHPATNISDLQETAMLQQRVDEYNILKSNQFIQSLTNFRLINFSQLNKLNVF